MFLIAQKIPVSKVQNNSFGVVRYGQITLAEHGEPEKMTPFCSCVITDDESVLPDLIKRENVVIYDLRQLPVLKAIDVTYKIDSSPIVETTNVPAVTNE